MDWIRKDITMTVASFKKVSLAASASTDEIDLGTKTLVGIHLPNLTSTSFTITAAPETGGTFSTVKDGLGTYATAGTAITFTIGADSTGYFTIPKDAVEGLRYIKIVFGSSETADIYLSLRETD